MEEEAMYRETIPVTLLPEPDDFAPGEIDPDDYYTEGEE